METLYRRLTPDPLLITHYLLQTLDQHFVLGKACQLDQPCQEFLVVDFEQFLEQLKPHRSFPVAIL